MIEKRKLKIGWVGFHKEGLRAFLTILKTGYDIKIVLTLKEEKLKEKSAYVDYNIFCKKHNIVVHSIKNINSQESVELLSKANIDILFVIGWGQILKSNILNLPKVGVVGAHASLLPSYKGNAPINWAIINGLTVTGNTLFWLSEELDGGDIIDQKSFEITLFDTCDTLYDKVAETNKQMILKFLGDYSGGIKISNKKQTLTKNKLLKRRKPEDGLIDWSRANLEVYNFIRGLTKPYPGAFTYLNGEKWYIWDVVLLPSSYKNDYSPGEIIGPVYSNQFCACGQLVMCGLGPLILLKCEKEKLYEGEILSNMKWKGSYFNNEKK